MNPSPRLEETNMKEKKRNIKTLNYAYMQHVEIIFGTQLQSFTKYARLTLVLM